MNKRLQQKVDEAKKKKAMRDAESSEYGLLAIDPAEKLGWAVNNNLYGTFDFKLRRDESAGMKFLRFRAKLDELIQLNNVKLVAFERPSGNKPAALISHSKFVVIIETRCQELGIEYRGYSASEIKKFATGKGNSGKPAMVEAAQEKLGYLGKDDNEADALWILNLLKSDLSI